VRRAGRERQAGQGPLPEERLAELAQPES
jgi:hypothetical protein